MSLQILCHTYVCGDVSSNGLTHTNVHMRRAHACLFFYELLNTHRGINVMRCALTLCMTIARRHDKLARSTMYTFAAIFKNEQKTFLQINVQCHHVLERPQRCRTYEFIPCSCQQYDKRYTHYPTNASRPLGISMASRHHTNDSYYLPSLSNTSVRTHILHVYKTFMTSNSGSRPASHNS